MPSIGPTLPPHLANKRKRSESESSEDGPAPAPAPRARSSSPGPSSAPSKAIGPTMPPSASQESQKPASKEPRRIIGPSLPPATLDELPQDAVPSPPAKNDDSEDDSSDDDLGPAPPPADGTASSFASQHEYSDTFAAEPSQPEALQRDDWMLAPPSGADWAQRIDPTKIKNRKFNTMKGAKAPSGAAGAGVGGLWTETPEQKRKRLEDEVLGTGNGAGGAGKHAQDSGDRDKERARRKAAREEKETERRVRAYNEANRGSTSLMDMHRVQKREKGEEEDDPSKRAFDREKDIAGSVGSALQRKNVLNQAKDMGSRFERAQYL